MIARIYYRRATGRGALATLRERPTPEARFPGRPLWASQESGRPSVGMFGLKNGNDFGSYVPYCHAMKLYYNPRSRATIAKWMLDECGAAYEIVPVDLQQREHKAPEFLYINPSGKLPALVDGNARIFETAAICLYLGDRLPEANLAPRLDAPERGRYLSLMVYS